MIDTQQQRKEIGGVKELVILVGILLTVVAGAIGTYWVRSQGVEAAGTSPVTGKAVGEPAGPRAVIPAPPVGVFHADVYFDFKSTRLRADAAKMLQDKAATMSRTDTWVVLVTGYADRQGPAVYNKVLAQRRADTVKQFLVELGVPESSVKVVALGPEATLCDDPGKECQQLNRRVHLEIRRLGPVAAAAVAPANADVQVP